MNVEVFITTKQTSSLFKNLKDNLLECASLEMMAYGIFSKTNYISFRFILLIKKWSQVGNCCRKNKTQYILTFVAICVRWK